MIQSRDLYLFFSSHPSTRRLFFSPLAQACTFCATGKMGIQRSLTSDEILAQMFFAKKICRLYQLPDVTNVVFMGECVM